MSFRRDSNILNRKMLRRIVVCLLVLAVLPLVVTSRASSQSYSTTTVTSTGTDVIFDTTITNEPTTVGRYCWWTYFWLNVTAGQELTGSFVSDKKINFYITTYEAYKAFEETSECVSPPKSFLHTQGVTTYSFDWNAPQDGTYYLIFFNPQIGTGFTFTFDLESPFVTVETTYVTFSSSTSTSALGTSTTLFSTGSSSTSQPASPFQGIPGVPIEGIIVGLALGIALILLRRPPNSLEQANQ